jgi:hypothetical protein
MENPKITRTAAIDRLPDDIAKKLVSLKMGQHGVYVIAFRGYYQDTMGKPGVNDRNLYDDCFCVVTPNEFATFNANTDPSVYRDANGNKQGIATLIPGLHYFKKGKHGISRPGGGYNAFRPATPDESLPVWRDGCGDKIFKGIAINIHRGGYNSTSSEGCQTVYPVQWNKYQVGVYDYMTRYKQDVLPYALIVWEQ